MGSEWRKFKVSEFAEVIGGGTPKTKVAEYWNGSIPWLTPKDLSNNIERYICRGERNISEKGLRNSSAKILPRKTVLLTSRAPVGYLAISKNELATNQGFRNLIVKEGFCPEFIYYLLLNNVEYLKRHASGSTFQELSGGTLKELEFEIPEKINEQLAIAHILGSLDDKIELNRKINKTLEAMARTIFKSWFIDFDPVIDNALRAGNPIPDSMAERAEIRRQMLDENQPSSSSPLSQKAKDRKYRGSFNFSGLSEVSIDEIHGLFPDSFQDSELGAIPKGWEVKSLGELCEKPQYGFTTSAKEEEVGPKFLRITDINKLPWIEWSNVPWCEITSAEFEKYKLRIGDFLITRMADPGHGVYIDEEVEAVFASYLIRFRPVDLRYGRYLQYWQHSSTYWNLINTRKAGTTRFSLNAKDLSAFPIIIPIFPLLEAFSVFINPIRQSIVHYVQESMILKSLRDILLPKLISGELRIPDAEKFVEEIVL
jgi:type I restriction enzyme S subunit